MLLLKIALLGDGAVGKTALRNRYMGRSFSGDYIMTIGADFSIKDCTVAGLHLKYQIWDLAGQPRFGAVRDLYYQGCVGGLLVFDVTRPESYMNMQEWIKELWTNNGKGRIPFVIVANKIDLRNEIENTIRQEYGINYAQQLSKITQEHGFSIPYVETSAKTGENVDIAFNNLGGEVIRFIKASPALAKFFKI